MGYVNFEEERYKATNQLKKRRENNKKLFNELIKSKKSPNTYNPDKEYSYKTFEYKHFGSKKVLNKDEFYEVSDLDIICAVFNKCTFGNIKFKNCSFIGCMFDECDFESGGVIFENCTFFKEESEKKSSLNRYDNFSCEFNKCSIYSKFDGCTLNYIIFDNCLINNTFFLLSDMNSMIINSCDLNRVRVEDCDLSTAKIISSYIIDLDFTDKMKTKIDEKTFFDKIEFRKKDRDEYEGIYMTYEVIADKFKENSLNNNFGEYYYLCKDVEKNVLKFSQKIWSYLYWATCGYGERPINSIVFSFIVIITFGILYAIFGIKIDDSIISISQSNIFYCLKEGIILSISLFSGSGATESIPANISEIFSVFEIIISVIMIGIGTGVIVRKLVR